MADYISNAILIALDREQKLGKTTAIKTLSNMFTQKDYKIDTKHRMAYLYNEGFVTLFLKKKQTFSSVFGNHFSIRAVQNEF
jgi:hypothetical protein